MSFELTAYTVKKDDLKLSSSTTGDVVYDTKGTQYWCIRMCSSLVKSMMQVRCNGGGPQNSKKKKNTNKNNTTTNNKIKIIKIIL